MTVTSNCGVETSCALIIAPNVKNTPQTSLYDFIVFNCALILKLNTRSAPGGFIYSDTFLVEEAWLQQPEPEPRIGLQPSLINQERELIEASLAETRGRISGPDGAARRLGVPRTTLESKIKSLRIDKYRYRVEARELSA